MSPEQARGEGHKVDGRSDVYSLSVILYQLLTGELPFRGNGAMLLHQVLHDEPGGPRTLNDKIPRDLETIALKAMAKEPDRRYANAKEMAEICGTGWLASRSWRDRRGRWNAPRVGASAKAADMANTWIHGQSQGYVANGSEGGEGEGEEEIP